MPEKNKPKFISIANRMDVNLENLIYAIRDGDIVTLRFVHGDTMEVPAEAYLEAKRYYGIGDDWEIDDESSQKG